MEGKHLLEARERVKPMRVPKTNIARSHATAPSWRIV
jgi:hypothetical protein